MGHAAIVRLVCTGAVTALGSAAVGGAGVEPLTTVRVATGLVRPVFVAAPPGDLRRLFIVEQHGSAGVVNRADIRVLDLGTTPPSLLATPYLSLTGLSTDGEQGLLGLAFHPDYWSNGLFYVNYTTNAGGGAAGRTVVARYQVSTNPNVADPGSAQQVITFDQPYVNHNGGWIGFGPDQYLYIATGDGGGGGDTENHAQTIVSEKLGKLLRLNVDGDDFPADPARNYAIPPTNPFVAGPMSAGDDELWAFGLRNPWRAGFDRLTGDLWIGDVGQGVREEIDFQAANVPGSRPGQPGYQGGRNYGWHCKEGLSCFDFGACCAAGPFVDPVLDYLHTSDPAMPGRSTGSCVIGGYVYRGCAMPSLRGHYFFADFSTGNIWSFSHAGGAIGNFVSRTAELDPPGPEAIILPSSFGEDARGELYICDFIGSIHKIVPASATVVTQDLNCDGHVNGIDIALLLGQWTGAAAYGPCPPHRPADLNQDCRVNGVDLAIVLGAWSP